MWAVAPKEKIILIARQRLAKHILAEAENIKSIAMQRHSKHASLTIQVMFSLWSVPKIYKKAQPNIMINDILLQTMTLKKDRPILSSERAPHNNKTVTVKQ
jgi:hypothetical protein